ncbi:MAG: SRPBCC family protein, partial [Kangiellaceae bacterium]|nr:SRPBCC family protein [Kangiellaceae bacterium]
MQTFLKVFGILVVIIIVGLTLSNKVDVRRTIEIDAPISSVHKFTSDLKEWPKWSPWLDEDLSIVTTLGPVTQGVGASQTWKGVSGGGSLQFTSSSTESGIEYDMQFNGDSTVYASGLSYQSDGYKTKTIVGWYMTGEIQPNIIGNYFAQRM